MKLLYSFVTVLGICIIPVLSANAAPPSAFGSGFDVQEFYRGFTLDEITPKNQQKWPYYKHVSANWDKFAIHGTARIKRSSKPARLTAVDEDERIDLNTEFKDGKSFIESLQLTREKALAIIYHFRVKSTPELQSNR